MIITILSIATIIVGIILFKKTDFDFAGFILLMISGIVTFVMAICLLCVQVNKDVDYQNALYQKEMIEYRIDHADEDIVGNELLYNDIVGYNNDLRFIKKWSNSYWTNWFFNEDIATIDYIELDME